MKQEWVNRLFGQTMHVFISLPIDRYGFGKLEKADKRANAERERAWDDHTRCVETIGSRVILASYVEPNEYCLMLHIINMKQTF